MPSGFNLQSAQACPVAGLDPDDCLVSAVAVRLKHRSLALVHIEPVFAESIENVRLVRDHDDVGAGRWHRSSYLAQGRATAVVLDRSNHESSLGVVSGGSHVAEIHQRAHFDRPLEKAGVNLADRDLKFTHRLSDRFC